MILCKIHVHDNDRILAACDQEILGMTFRGDGVKIKVSEIFYGGEPVSEEVFIERTKSVTIMNLVGNNVVGKAVEEGLVSEESVMVRQYGAGWMLNLQGDIVATAVEWCHRDYTAGGYRPTADEIVRAYYDYSYYDLFEEMGLSKLRPPSALESGLVSTYAHAMAEE